jgi:hypothetical protein
MNIVNLDVKEYYDIIQLNEEKITSRLTKNDIRRMKKLANKEESSDEEIKKEFVNKCKNLKKLLLKLDKKIEEKLSYQERAVKELQIPETENLKKLILKGRLEYENYRKKNITVDIKNFEKFDDEYNKLAYLKLPFENLTKTDLIERLREYNNNYRDQLYKLQRLENNYNTILRNCEYYDNYTFEYEETKYFHTKEGQYGILGVYYYKNNKLITKEEYNKAKNEISECLDLEKNYSFLEVQLSQSNNKLGIKNVLKYDSWYLLVDQEKIILYSKDGIVKISKMDCLYYTINKTTQGRLVFEIMDVKKLAGLLESEYKIQVMFNSVVGIKSNLNGEYLKQKVDLKIIDLEENYNFGILEEIKEGRKIRITKEIVEGMEKLKSGDYGLSIEKGHFLIRKKVEKASLIKIPLEGGEKMEEIEIYKEKSKVEIKTFEECYIIQTRDKLVITNTKQYQIYNIQREEQENE